MVKDTGFIVFNVFLCSCCVLSMYRTDGTYHIAVHTCTFCCCINHCWIGDAAVLDVTFGWSTSLLKTSQRKILVVNASILFKDGFQFVLYFIIYELLFSKYRVIHYSSKFGFLQKNQSLNLFCLKIAATKFFLLTFETDPTSVLEMCCLC